VTGDACGRPSPRREQDRVVSRAEELEQVGPLERGGRCGGALP
jgi:hypothetical protein